MAAMLARVKGFLLVDEVYLFLHPVLVGGGIGIVDDQGHALHGVVEVLLFPEPVIAQKIAVVGGEYDNGPLGKSERLDLFEDGQELRIDGADVKDLQGFYQSAQATAASCQVNNLHLLRGMLGRPGAGG